MFRFSVSLHIIVFVFLLYHFHSLFYWCLSPHGIVGVFLTSVANIVNIVGASSKCRDILQAKQSIKVIKTLKIGERTNKQGLNQENEMKRSYDIH